MSETIFKLMQTQVISALVSIRTALSQSRKILLFCPPDYLKHI